jgi:putative PIN family toxin of toxin-antitoxin system
MRVSPSIVIDTNVLLSALKSKQGTSHRLLSLLDAGLYTVHLSAPLVAEYESVLKRGQLQLTDSQVDDVIDYLCAVGTHHQIFYLWRPVLKDPDDDFVLELAVKASARIVTWNVRDFQRAQGFGIIVQTPRQLLEEMERKS